jgi:Ca2+-binding RTX toxin-like protein
MPAITVHAYRGSLDYVKTPFGEIFDLSSIGSDPAYVESLYGKDYIVTASGDDIVYGGPNQDLIVTNAGDDIVFGDSYWNDERGWITDIFGGYSTPGDVILSGAGNDVVHAGGGYNKVNAGSGDDWIDARGGYDTIFGGFGNDTIFGGESNDTLYGGTPETLDLLYYDTVRLQYNGLDGAMLPYSVVVTPETTGLGENALLDTGNDYLDGGDGDDLIVGQAGNDTLIGGAGDDTIDGGSDIDTIDGGSGRDIIGGGDGNDSISGGDGNDHLDGAAGNDYILAGDGEDLVTGGVGNDVLYGGDDSDVFLFHAGDGADIIADFVAGSQADAVALSGTGLTSFEDVMAHMSFYAAGNASYIQVGTDQLFFANVTPNQFDASDFIFV